MSPAALPLPQTERRSAQIFERAVPQEGDRPVIVRDFYVPDSVIRAVPEDEILAASPTDTSVATPSSPIGTTIQKPPGTTAALIGVVVFLGIIILCISSWRFYLWRLKRKLNEKESSSNRGLWSPISDHAFGINRSSSGRYPRPAVLFPSIATDTATRWVPAKIRQSLRASLPARPPAAKTKHSASESTEKLTLNMAFTEKTSPPPNYRVITVTTPTPPSSLQSTSPPLDQPMRDERKLPPPAPAPTKALPSRPISNMQKLLIIPEQEDSVPPVPSPLRSASLSPKPDVKPSDGNKLPRLMTVKQPFKVSLHDELHVRVGETVRLLQEYQDGWTLCQRVGRADAEKGAVPRCCLIERQPAQLPPRKSSEDSRPPSTRNNRRPSHKASASTSSIPTVKSTEPLAPRRGARRGSLVIGINHIQHPYLTQS